MATSLAARLTLALIGQLDNPIDVGTPSYPINYNQSQQFTDGTGQDQAQKIWTDTRTIAPSGTDDLDLNATLLDAFGAAFTITKIKALLVKAPAANVNDVVIGGAASNQIASIFGAVAHTIKCKPGGTVLLIAPDANGYAVVAATGDLLRIANSAAGTPVDYTIIIIGS